MRTVLGRYGRTRTLVTGFKAGRTNACSIVSWFAPAIPVGRARSELVGTSR